MRELVVLSGKGGTGKTSILASFASLADGAVIADCDVDAADLHLVLDHTVTASGEFKGGKRAVVDTDSCITCWGCVEACRFGAVSIEPGGGHIGRARVDSVACEGCGACTHVCPTGAISLEEVVTGEWFVSESRAGTLVHAALGAGQEASGKLVTLVRSRAGAMAKREERDLVLVDGPPGIGCPVIASLTGATLALIVAEPSVAGLHDLERVVQLAGKLGVPVVAAINKWDVSPGTSARIEELCTRLSVPMIGRVPYDDDVTAAQVSGVAVVDYSNGAASTAVRNLWGSVLKELENSSAAQ
jgi:MinD superfamily P-loop ATPase